MTCFFRKKKIFPNFVLKTGLFFSWLQKRQNCIWLNRFHSAKLCFCKLSIRSISSENCLHVPNWMILLQLLLFVFFCLGSAIKKMICIHFVRPDEASVNFFLIQTLMYVVYSFRKKSNPKKIQLNPKLKSSLPVILLLNDQSWKKKWNPSQKSSLHQNKKTCYIIVVHNQAIFINLRNSTLKNKKKHTTTYIIKDILLKKHFITDRHKES